MPSVFGCIPSGSRYGNVPNELIHRAGPPFLDNHYRGYQYNVQYVSLAVHTLPAHSHIPLYKSKPTPTHTHTHTHTRTRSHTHTHRALLTQRPRRTHWEWRTHSGLTQCWHQAVQWVWSSTLGLTLAAS